MHGIHFRQRCMSLESVYHFQCTKMTQSLVRRPRAVAQVEKQQFSVFRSQSEQCHCQSQMRIRMSHPDRFLDPDAMFAHLFHSTNFCPRLAAIVFVVFVEVRQFVVVGTVAQVLDPVVFVVLEELISVATGMGVVMVKLMAVRRMLYVGLQLEVSQRPVVFSLELDLHFCRMDSRRRQHYRNFEVQRILPMNATPMMEPTDLWIVATRQRWLPL